MTRFETFILFTFTIPFFLIMFLLIHHLMKKRSARGTLTVQQGVIKRFNPVKAKKVDPYEENWVTRESETAKQLFSSQEPSL